jgi:steroid delta-isomerase-like uncharacterized protein
MTETEKIIREYYSRVWEKNETEAVHQLFAETYVNHAGARGTLKGPEGILTNYRNTRDAFRDCTFTLEKMLIAGKNACAYYKMAGTHTGTFMGIPATGKSVNVPGIGIYMVSGGKIQESWVVRDTLVLLRQLGADFTFPQSS